MTEPDELTRLQTWNASLRENLTHIAGQLVERTNQLSELRAEWHEVLERQDALLAKASATLTQAKHQITWTAALAFASGIALAVVVGVVV